MGKMEVTAHVLTNIEYGNFYEQFNGFGFNDFKSHPEAFHKWVAFTTVMYCPDDNLIHCGLTRFDNDILYTFDRENQTFKSLCFQDVAEPYDVKIHRSLVMNNDGFIYGATALLHDIDENMKAPGGKIFRYRPYGKDLEILCTPIPHSYIQSIALDQTRQMLYGFTFVPERFFSYSIKTGEVKDFGPVGSGQAHRPCIDDNGCVWGTWGSYYSRDLLPTEGNAIKLLKYDPQDDNITFFPYGLKGPDCESQDTIDELINGLDGYIYIGTHQGCLYRLEPKNAEVEFLGKPFWHQRRISGLTMDKQGLIYGAAGDRDCARLFTFDRDKKQFTELGVVYDHIKNQPAEKIHCLTITDDNVLFGGEIDNLHRASYLWECKLEI